MRGRFFNGAKNGHSGTEPHRNSRGTIAGLRTTVSLAALAASMVSALAGNETIDGGATVTVPSLSQPSPWNITGSLTVGGTGAGTLNIEEGGDVSSVNGYLGAQTGSSGTVVVTGADSSWIGTGELGIGLGGQGTFTVSAGAEASFAYSYVGVLAGSNNTATVTGTDSIWTSTTVINVGYNGLGTVTVEAGGTLTGPAGIVGAGTNSIGTVTVTGEGSSWTATTELGIGQSGNGTLNVEAGGEVSTGIGYIAVNANAIGTATVTGNGSTWTNTAELHVGYGGIGSLTVEDTGHVSTVNAYVGTNSGSTGTLTLNSGATASSSYAYIGVNTGSNGGVTVTGAETVWTNSNDFVVGGSGIGQMTVSAGGAVNSGNGYVGLNALSTGTVTVTGAESSWSTGSFSLFIGLNGAGTLNVQASGKIASGEGVLGNNVDSTGTATVTGAGSNWDLGASSLYVGFSGGGTLNIEAEGAVESGAGVIGYTAGSIGNATVTGVHSSWNTGNEYLYVGQFGNGTLTIENSGEVSSAKTFIGNEAGSSGTLNLNGDENGRGVLATGKIIRGAGAATLNFDGGVLTATDDEVDFLSGFAAGDVRLAAGGGLIDTNGHDVDVDAAIQGVGGLTKQGDGTLTLTGTNTYAGGTTVAGGHLVVAGSVGGDVAVESGAILSGSGSIGAAVQVQNGGTIAGTQSAPLTMGTLTLGATSAVDVTLGSPGGGPVFIVVSNLTLDGALNVTADPGFSAGVYRIFNYGGTLIDNGLDVTAVSGLATNVQTAVAGQVNLLVSDPGQSILFWNGTTITPTGTVGGGNGTWTAGAQVNWTDSTGTVPQSWNGGFAVFEGAAGAVTVDASAGTVTITGMQFVTTGYLLTGDQLTLSGSALASVRVGDGTAAGAGTVATIASALVGTSGIDKTDLGTLVLTGDNTYAGGTTVSAGSLQIGNGGTTGSIVGDVTDNATLAFNRSDDVTFAGVVSGSGALVQAGAGTLTLTGANTYSGGTTVSAGTLAGNTTSLQGNIVDNAAVVFNQTATGIYAGAMSGTGSMTKTGAGTLILTGDNTYTGGTTISEGTLQIGNGGTTGALVGAIVNNAALVFNRSDTYNFPGTITGQGSVTILGGTVNFASANAYSGPISVADATLELAAGAVSTSSFTIGTGGTIGGTGTIGGLSVLDGGTASPGYSPGTLAVNGNVSFAAGSVYRVDVDANGTHDLITATGAATISGGTVQVVAQNGYATPLATYTILTAQGGVSGQFAEVTTNYAFLTPFLTYDTNDVYLTLARNNTSFASLATSSNQKAVATATQSLGLGNTVYDAVLRLSVTPVPGTFESLSGEAYASASSVMNEQSSYLREAVGTRIRQGLAGRSGGGQETTQLAPGYDATVWTQGYGGWGQTAGNGNTASVDRTIGGFFTGIDAALSEAARFGLVGGYSRSTFNLDARSSSGDIDNYDLGLYGGARFGSLSILAAASYTWHDVSVDRTIAFPGFSGLASSDYKAGTTQVFGEAAWHVDLSKHVDPRTFGAASLEPFANLAYVNLSSDNFTETGTPAALTGSAETQNTLYSTLGIRAATVFELSNGAALMPHVSLGWQHAFGDVNSSASLAFASGSSAFTVSGVPIARDAALFGAGFDYAFSKSVSASMTYSGQFGNGTEDNAFKGTINIKF